MLCAGIDEVDAGEEEKGCPCFECDGCIVGGCRLIYSYAGGSCCAMLLRMIIVLAMAILGCVYVLAPLKTMSFAPALLSSQPGYQWEVNGYTYLFDPQCNEKTNLNATKYLMGVLQPSYYSTCGCHFPGDDGWRTNARPVSGLDAQVACTIFVAPAFFWLVLSWFSCCCPRWINKPVSLAISPIGMAFTALWIATFWLVIVLTWIDNQEPMNLCWPNVCNRNEFGDATDVKLADKWHVDGASYNIGSPAELEYVRQFVTSVCSNVFLTVDPPNYSLRVPILPSPALANQLSELQSKTFVAALWLLKLTFVPLLIISPRQIRRQSATGGAYCAQVSAAAKLCCSICFCQQQTAQPQQHSPAVVSPSLAPPLQSITIHALRPSAPSQL